MINKCPHSIEQVTTISGTKNVSLRTPAIFSRISSKVSSCDSCKNAGPNLWICMQRNCFRIGCSERANDHSTQHFKLNYSHCVHMNLSTQRMWCYICEMEVFFENEGTSLIKDFLELPDEDLLGTLWRSDESEKNYKNIQGIVGLQNLANTCYMNSALQALSNIQPLTYYFLDCGDLVQHTVDLPAYQNKCELAKSYLRLIKEIWCTKNRAKDFIAPRSILYGIRNVHPVFRGFQQHDTQEFLRCFMDQLHEELKQKLPRISSTEYANAKEFNVNNNEQIIKNDGSEIALNMESDSASQSEAEYETCDSGVSEQSSLFGELSLDERYNENVFSVQKYNFKTSGLLKHQSKSINAFAMSGCMDRSIISDVFDGKLLSSVQCLTCDRISTREETFQDLSLPIPNRDYLYLLHQNQGAQNYNSFAYGLRSANMSEIIKNDDWLTWIWKIIRSWLWGPSVTLHDCMASFFSADELKGDNMYSCEKCNKLRTGVKFSRILDLPETLCIHLKRFRHDLSYSSKISSHIKFPLEYFDMSPYLHKECKSNVSVYNLVSVICHYGTVGGGHYTCFAKNKFTNKWYEFDDQKVTEVTPDTVENSQAYVLFYCKHNQHMNLIRSEARLISNSNPSYGSNMRFYIAQEWLTRFNTFAEPGPINNWAILCIHGGLPPQKVDIVNKIAVSISQQLWDYLYEKFGGGPAINLLFECEFCKKAADILTRRQNNELSIFTKYNDLENSNTIFAISMPWLRKWQQFARGITHKEPGPITNLNISANTDNCLTPPIRNVKSGSDYAQINEHLWGFLHNIYGGGPKIVLRKNQKVKMNIPNEDHYNTDISDSKTHIETNNNAHQSQSETTRLIKLQKPSLYAKIGGREIQIMRFNKMKRKQTKNLFILNKKSGMFFDHNTSKSRTKQRRSCTKRSGFLDQTI